MRNLDDPLLSGVVTFGTAEWTTSAGAPATTPPDGSFHSRTAGGAASGMYGRVNGAWVQFGGASSITGADTQVLFFDGIDTPAGDPGMTYVKATGTLTVGDLAVDSGSVTLAGFTLSAPGAGGTLVTTATLSTGGLAGSFTTLAASGAVTGAGFTARFASPGPIGNTAAGTGAFTTLSASGAITTSTLTSTGALAISSTAGGSLNLTGSGYVAVSSTSGLFLTSTTPFSFNGDTILRRESVAVFQLGDDAATGVNQKLKAMDASAGTGGNLTLAGGLGTTAGGALVFQTAVNTAGGYVDRLTISAGGVATFSGQLLGSLSITAAASGYYGWGASAGGTLSLMSSPSNGVILFQNNATTDFNRLQFGGTTSSFPALKRSTTKLQMRLADDSAYAAFDVLELQASGTKVVGAQGAAVADATDEPTAVTQLNTLLARLRAHGLIAT